MTETVVQLPQVTQQVASQFDRLAIPFGPPASGTSTTFFQSSAQHRVCHTWNLNRVLRKKMSGGINETQARWRKDRLLIVEARKVPDRVIAIVEPIEAMKKKPEDSKSVLWE